MKKLIAVTVLTLSLTACAAPEYSNSVCEDIKNQAYNAMIDYHKNRDMSIHNDKMVSYANTYTKKWYDRKIKFDAVDFSNQYHRACISELKSSNVNN